MYVTELVAPGVANTMPEPTLEAVLDHGRIESDAIRGNYTDAHRVLDELRDVGINYDDVVQSLEDEGLRKFIGSWTELERQVHARLTTNSVSQSTA